MHEGMGRRQTQMEPRMHVCTHTPTRTLERILRMRAYVCIHAHALLCTHICTHTCTQSCTSGARADDPPAHAPAHSAGAGVKRGGGGTHRILRLGQSAAAGSAASSVSPAFLRADRAAAPGGSGPPLN